MILADYHCHTYFSTDSDTPVEAQIESAIQRGLQHLCITDHEDIDYNEAGDFLVDIPKYFQTLNVLKQKYQGKINLHIGIELGLQPHLTRELPTFVAASPYEYVIGSTHAIDRLDPYYPEVWKNYASDRDAILRYYEQTLQNIRQFDCFDSYGHLDYIVRYAPDKTQTHTYADYRDLIDEILRELIVRGKGLECNTAGFHYGLHHPNPHEDVLRRYLELGGEIITVGSDAHTPERVGECFEKLPELLQSCGARYYTIFENRKPVFLPL